MIQLGEALVLVCILDVHVYRKSQRHVTWTKCRPQAMSGLSAVLALLHGIVCCSEAAATAHSFTDEATANGSSVTGRWKLLGSGNARIGPRIGPRSDAGQNPQCSRTSPRTQRAEALSRRECSPCVSSGDEPREAGGPQACGAAHPPVPSLRPL